MPSPWKQPKVNLIFHINVIKIAVTKEFLKRICITQRDLAEALKPTLKVQIMSRKKKVGGAFLVRKNPGESKCDCLRDSSSVFKIELV